MFEFVIYSLAGKEIVDVLTGINMIMNTTGFKIFMGVAALLGFFHYLIKWITHTTDIAKEGKMMIVIYVLIFGFLLPRTDVHVRDVMRGATYIVGDTSLGVGMMASIITNITYWQTKIYATAYSTPATTIDPYSIQGGYLSPIQYMYLLREISVSQSEIENTPEMKRLGTNLKEYINGCYVPYLEWQKVNDAVSYTATQDNMWGAMSVPMHAWTIRVDGLPVNGVNTTGLATCPEAYEGLSSELMQSYVRNGLLDHLIRATKSTANIVDPSTNADGSERTQEQLRTHFSNMISSVLLGDGPTWVLNTDGQMGDPLIVTSDSLNSNSTLGDNSVSNMQNDKVGALMRNLYIFRVFNKAVNNYYSRQLGTNAWQATLFDGLAHKNLSMANSAWSFGQYMMPVIGFIEALIYSLLPIAIFLMLTLGSSGLKTVWMYVMAFFWVGMWPLSYVIIHHWLVGKFIDSVNKLITSGSPKEISDVLQAAQTELGSGGMWIGIVPLITLFIVMGSMYTFNTIATQIQGSEKMNEQNMHRDTYDAKPLYSMVGDTMQAARFAFGTDTGVGNNAFSHQQGLQTKYNVGQQIGNAVSYQREVAHGATEAYQSNVNNALQHALKNGVSSNNKWGFSLQDSSSFTDSNSEAYKFAEQVAQKSGLSIGKEGVEQLANMFAGGVAGKFGFNAEGKMQVNYADLEKYGLSRDQFDSMVNDLARDEKFQQDWSNRADLKKDASFDETHADDVTKQMQRSLTASHDSRLSANEKLALMENYQNTIGGVQQLESSALGSGILSAVAYGNNNESARWQALVGNEDIQRLAEQKFHNPQFREVWGNNVFGGGDTPERRGEEAIMLAAQMEAVKDYAAQNHDPTLVAEMLSIGASQVGGGNAQATVEAKELDQGARTAAQFGHEGAAPMAAEAGEMQKRVDGHIVPQAKQATGETVGDLKDVDVPNAGDARQNEGHKVTADKKLTAKTYEEAQKLQQALAEKKSEELKEKYEDSDLVRSQDAIREALCNVRLNLKDGLEEAQKSRVADNPVVNGYIGAMETSDSPQIREQAAAIRKEQEELARKIKAGTATMDDLLDFGTELTKGTAMFAAHGLEKLSDTVKGQVLDAYYEDNKDHNKELSERYKEDMSYAEKARVIYETSPEYQSGQSASSAQIEASMKELLAEQLDEEANNAIDWAFDYVSLDDVWRAYRHTDADSLGEAYDLVKDSDKLLTQEERVARGTIGPWLNHAMKTNYTLGEDSRRDSYKEAVEKLGVERQPGFALMSDKEQVDWLMEHHPRYKEVADELKAQYGGKLPTKWFSTETDYETIMARVVEKEYESGAPAATAARNVAARGLKDYDDLAEYMSHKGLLSEAQKEELHKAKTPVDKAMVIEKYLGNSMYADGIDKLASRAEKLDTMLSRMEKERELVENDVKLPRYTELLKDASNLLATTEGAGVMRDNLIEMAKSEDLLRYLVDKETKSLLKQNPEMIEAGLLSANPDDVLRSLAKTSPELKSVYDASMAKLPSSQQAMMEVYKALIRKHGG
jgi:hypothetical protein